MELTTTNKVSILLQYMTTAFPCELVQKLSKYFWILLQSDFCAVAVCGTPMPLVSFIRIEGQLRLAVLIPDGWEETPSREIGALLRCASQVIDHYNGQMVGKGDISRARARMYEAQFLRVTVEHDSTFEPDEHQAEVMREFSSMDTKFLYAMRQVPAYSRASLPVAYD